MGGAFLLAILSSGSPNASADCSERVAFLAIAKGFLEDGKSLPPEILRQPRVWTTLVQIAEERAIGRVVSLGDDSSFTEHLPVLEAALKPFLVNRSVSLDEPEQVLTAIYGALLKSKGSKLWDENFKPAHRAFSERVHTLLVAEKFEEVLGELGLFDTPEWVQKVSDFHSRHLHVRETIKAAGINTLWFYLTHDPMPPYAPRATALKSLTREEVRQAVATHGYEAAQEHLWNKYYGSGKWQMGVPMVAWTERWNTLRRWYGRAWGGYAIYLISQTAPVKLALSGLFVSKESKQKFENDTFNREKVIDFNLQSWIKAETFLRDGQRPSENEISSKLQELNSWSDNELRAYPTANPR